MNNNHNGNEISFRDEKTFRISALEEFGVVISDNGSSALVHVPAHADRESDSPTLRFAAVSISRETLGNGEVHWVTFCRCCRVDSPDDEGEPCASSNRPDFLCYHAMAAGRLLSAARVKGNRGLLTIYWGNNEDKAREKARERNAMYGRFRPEGSSDDSGLPVVFFPSRERGTLNHQPAPTTLPAVTDIGALQQQLAAMQQQIAAMNVPQSAPPMTQRLALILAAGLSPLDDASDFTDDDLRRMIGKRGETPAAEPSPIKLKGKKKPG